MITDITGMILIPGNGLHPGVECCCEECDYLMCCCEEYKQISCQVCQDPACPRSNAEAIRERRP